MMHTRHLSPDQITEAALLLQRSELIAFPTETVYGLGANALQREAVDKIFQAKGRPSDNPLIVHLAQADQVMQVARSVSPLASVLMKAFWPGPLTLVLPKRSEVPSNVTAGLDTVAVRVPHHELALRLIRASGLPLAAPSANRSGRPSATTWQAVAEDLDGRIAGILCGEPTLLGIESTVVDTTCNPPRILRPGGVTLESLQSIASEMVAYEGSSGLEESKAIANSPGLKHRHYQPRAQVKIVGKGEKEVERLLLDKVALATYIGCAPPTEPYRFANVLLCTSVQEYAAKLFDFFRHSDSLGAQLICCEQVSEVGMGVALMDRVRRASQT